MEYRPLDITLISAKDLNDVNVFSKMDVYAIVSLSNDPRSKQKTHVDKDSGKNPTWNFPMKFNVPDQSYGPPVVLHIQLRSDRSLGDRDIGEVHIPIKDLLNTAGLSSGGGPSSAAQFVSYQVRKPSGKPKGVLNLSFKFGEKVSAPIAAAAAAATTPVAVGAKGDEPVTAYPAAAGPSGYPTPGGGYHPPAAPYPAPAGQYPPQPAYPAAYGYSGYPPPPPQPYGYGYPPPPAGYGYTAPVVAPPQQPPRKNNKFGMGLGAGLLGGALGGLLIGDMISDSSDAYDAGFDDGGGFDF